MWYAVAVAVLIVLTFISYAACIVAGNADDRAGIPRR